MKLTSTQAELLRGADQCPGEVFGDCYTGGTIAAAIRKGWVRSDGTKPFIDAALWITPAGLAALAEQETEA